MKITILTVGKRHEPWVKLGIERFLERLRPPFATEMVIIPNSSLADGRARQDESKQLHTRLKPDDYVILLDERGKNISSPQLSEIISQHSSRSIIFIIGGAYGVDNTLRNRADIVWSLSNLVFPHQLVRLILAEQLYRAQEISRGSKYHHD